MPDGHSASTSRYAWFLVALLVPVLAGLIGLLNSFRMMRLPDIEPSHSGEGTLLG